MQLAAQLKQTGRLFPRCAIRRFTENESGGYLIGSPDFPSVVASGAMHEEATARARRVVAKSDQGGSREARADRGGLNSKVRVLEKGDFLRSRRDETRSSTTTGWNEIIEDCFWISYDYQELSSKIGRQGT
jgi:hypothetical protein